MTTSRRKLDHIRICLEKPVEASSRPFEDVLLIHRALPEICEGEIETSCRFLGYRLKAPIIITGMTGGHPDTREINLNLARAAQEMGLAMGVGSQRAALEDPRQVETFSLVRDAAPDVPIIGNIGAVQLQRSGPKVLERLAEMIEADAIAVHLNFLQESVQPEGDRDAKGVIEALSSASDGGIPIIVKETGAGISREAAEDLISAGVKIMDVSGTGGTSWSGVEAYRGEEAGDTESARMGRLFWEWGIPTPASIVECRSAGAQVIGSGGVRSGLDVARCLALGGSMAGIALPLLYPATKSKEDTVAVLKDFVRALRTAMFLTGCRNIPDLQKSPLVILGKTREWLEQRGFDTRKFSAYRE
ncbi:MAG: type 2 isopentenyl-diphosphate Delta-isomerase [Methanotrichaceae archaeon]|nr:type 2 isopentenyl-diphosphate Delta-isomerase [Methanotrichaceae archaeon]